MEIICIDPVRAEEFWPHVQHLIARAMTKCNISDTAEVQRALRVGQALLWIAWEQDTRSIKAAAVTEITSVHGKRYCTILALAGKGLSRWLEFMPVLENYARGEGCRAMRLMGRKGWARVLRDWTQKHIILERLL